MFTTGQFRVFATEPSERVLARPRHLMQESRVDEAEDAYRALIATQPDLKLAWAEYFQLLRSQQRFEEALALAARAEAQFGADALPVALKGAALVELGRYREGLTALEAAAEIDPDLGMVWHEAGYAAYRLNEFPRALLALDRAFALEPHSGTLHLRGKILRQAGRHTAAEVAFEGAAESAEFAVQRIEAERQIGVTRRYAAFPGRPDTLSPSRRWFADTGAAVMTSPSGSGSPSTLELLDAFVELARWEGWRFTSLVRTDDWTGWTHVASALDLRIVDSLDSADGAVPLIVARRPYPGHVLWSRAEREVAVFEHGLTFALEQPGDMPTADVVATLDHQPRARLDLPAASEAVQHPESRLRGRRLRAATG